MYEHGTTTFKGLVLEHAGGALRVGVQSLEPQALPDGDVTVAVEYSSLNYKDGLVLTGAGGLVKSYPHVPGIDLAGTVLESRTPAWRAGERVLLTGWRVGENRWGGYAERARVRGEWLVRPPATLSARESMAIGTAGLTAMLAVLALEEHGLRPDAGDVLVTGAAGGVGSVATALLAARGYRAVASTGRAEAGDYLRGLGAAEVIDRAPFTEQAKRPLETERWAACIDSVGGNTLARVLAQCRYGASVAAVGLAGGAQLATTVIPFLLRGVNLLGIDSVACPLPRREQAWKRIASDLPRGQLTAITREIALGEVPAAAESILKGQIRGRVVVNVRR